MKTRHNKKRNSAFVYEALVREATVAMLRKDTPRCNTVVKIIKKHFKDGSLLKYDLECHRSLYENQSLDKETSEKILREAKISNRLLDADGLFKEQSKLIHDINKELEPSVFGNFVPNYKSLASIAQIFSNRISPKNQVILESEIIKNMMNPENQNQEFPEIDHIVVRAFTEKFNNKYDKGLLAEQKKLLTYYISSFADNALELKIFLNEEIARLKTQLEEARSAPNIKNDNEMLQKTDQIIARLNEFAHCSVDDTVLLTILKTQSLVKEIYSDGNHS